MGAKPISNKGPTSFPPKNNLSTKKSKAEEISIRDENGMTVKFTENESLLLPFSNLVSILSVEVKNKGIEQTSGICNLPNDAIFNIIRCITRCEVQKSKEEEIKLNELLRSYKIGILSLMSTCYQIYVKTRDVFKICPLLYLEEMKGSFLEERFKTLRLSWYLLFYFIYSLLLLL